MEEKYTTPVEVVDIRFRPGQKVYYFSPGGLKIRAGEHVVMDTARGPEFGFCTGGNHFIPQKDVVSPLRQVLRIATAADEKIMDENREREKRAFALCQQKIAEQGLDMQLVSAECAFDGSKILFSFTADERVDFRELVKVLASAFHTRIELHQIGVRDKAKAVGGLGICGRPFCCTFLDDYQQPISIKMAKTQSLSLNPNKISGTCGRLMCCLKYEQETYEDLIRSAPKMDSLVDTPEGRGTITEVDLLRQQVKVRLEDQPEDIVIYGNDEIAILRAGKARKTDQPIPADVAPISGAAKPPKKEQPEEAPGLEPIRFKYRSDAVVEPQVPVETTPEVSQESKKTNRRKKNRPQQNRNVPEKTAASPEKSQAAPEGGEKPKNRHFHRRHRGNGGNKPAQ